MKGKVVVTTAIPGSGRDTYLKNFSEYANARGKKVKIYPIGDMLFDFAKRINIRLHPEKILNTPPDKMRSLRGMVLEFVHGECMRLIEEGYVIILNLHSMFYWRHAYYRAIDAYYLKRFGPTFYVNFLDDVDATLQTLKQRTQWRRELFPDDRPSWYATEKILDWQSAEVECTAMWAERDAKRLFVVPSKASPNILYRLLFEPWRKIFYFGMPITLLHGDEYAEARAWIDSMASWLDERVILIDPRLIEPLSPEHLENPYMPMDDQIVRRDLYWLIPLCDGMVATYPERAFSAGENNEMREVHETNGEVFIIYPPGPISPFITRWTDRPVYRDENHFKIEFDQWLGEAYLAKAKSSLPEE